MEGAELLSIKEVSSLDMPGTAEPSEEWEFFTVYKTPKYVAMRSKTLRVSELVILSFVFLYIIGYQMLYKLRFMHAAKAEAVHSMSLLAPQTNFWTCQKLYGTCIHRYPSPAAFHYCGEDSSAKCRTYEANAIGKISGKHFFIATRKVYGIQESCDKDDEERWTCKDLWVDSNTTSESFFVGGVENYLVKLQHTYSSAAIDTELYGSDTQGFLQYNNGTVLPMPCYTRHGTLIDTCKYESSPWGSEAIPCGDAEHDGRGCFSYVSGDFISLGVLMKAAGADLDKSRSTGMMLGIEITYTNLDPADFYFRWPIGPTPKYIIQPRVLRLAGNKSEVLVGHQTSDDLGTLTKGRQQRHLMTEFGIEIVITVKGEIGRFQAFHFLIFVSVSMSLLQVAKFVVNHLLVSVYFRMPRFKSASLLHTYYEHEETVVDDDLHPFIETQAHPDVLAEEWASRHKQATRKKMAQCAVQHSASRPDAERKPSKFWPQ